MEKSSKYTVAMRILVSAMGGVLFTCVMLSPIAIIYQLSYGMISKEAAIEKIPDMLISMLSGIGIFPLGFIIASPLIALAMLAGVIFKEDIQKDLRVWCYVSAISVWLVMCIIITWLTDNAYYSSRSFIEGFFTTLTRIDSLAYLIGPAFSSLIFYYLSVPKSEAHISKKSELTAPEPRHQDDQ